MNFFGNYKDINKLKINVNLKIKKRSNAHIDLQ